MQKSDYLARKQAGARKPNGQFKQSVLARMAEELRDTILNLKRAYYTSQRWYGMALANRPRNKKGKRVYFVTNF